MDNSLNLPVDWLPPNCFDNQKDKPAAVQCRKRQEIHDPQIHRNQLQTLPGQRHEKLNSDIIFTIGEDGTVSVDSTGHSGWLSSKTNETEGKTTYTLTIPNGKVKDFEFHKVWFSLGSSTEKQSWKQDITVILYKENNKGNDTKIAEYLIRLNDGEFVITPISSINGETAPVLQVQDSNPDDNDYEFVIKDLPFGNTYYLVENAIDGYLTKYGKAENNVIVVVPGADKTTEDTPYIINRDTGGIELPSTGGVGTGIFRIGGMLLIATALILERKYKKKRDKRQG